LFGEISPLGLRNKKRGSKMNKRSDVFSPIDGPAHEARNDSSTAGRVQKQGGILGGPPLPKDAIDKRATVKWIWQALTDPERPWDTASVDLRIRLIQFLEKLLRKDFTNIPDLKLHVERFLEGLDGRRMPVSQAIKRVRKKRNLTQRQLAELLGLKDHTLISKYENGERVPPEKVLAWLKEGEM
jgi:DNA-binding XRE family transcriptional regulator